VRDFSINDASVRPDYRGTYMAFTEAESNGMRHLRALSEAGLSDVHLLPVFDIATIPESGCVTPAPSGAPNSESQQAAVGAVREQDCFNWGYDPYHFTAPEGSYATDASDGLVRLREFRAMVQALHQAGLRVGMDVVYNHTSSSGQQQRSVLDRVVPDYYQRYNVSGNVETSTCCDNTATENRMMAKLMIESIVTWARDYRIDSFRFDLMGHQPRAVMEALQQTVNQAVGHHVELLGEGWNFGEVESGARFEQASQLSLNGSGIATFSDRARDAVRGGGCCDGGDDLVIRQGWLNGLHYAPNAMAAGRHSRADLLRSADLVRVGLAGSLRDFVLQDHRGEQVTLAQIDYAGQPAGYVSEPFEVVNYVENHDNPTLFDINALKLPRPTSPAERARVQMLGAAVVAFSQGIAYYHAGIETLRSKSLDRNSFNSGDWFNRLDWTYRDNNWGVGLPPAWDNGSNWHLMRPLLGEAGIKPAPAEITWMRDAFLDLLRIRSGTTLLRLRSAADIRQRLRLLNTGPQQIATVLVGHVDGEGYAGAGFLELLYFINVDLEAHALTLPSERGKAWNLHPLQASTNAADARPREQAAVDSASGRFNIPARSAVVYVLE
jgi:pullulanase-type alpha-1,6-glucosidase